MKEDMIVYFVFGQTNFHLLNQNGNVNDAAKLKGYRIAKTPGYVVAHCAIKFVINIID